MNQEQTLCSAVTAKPQHPMGRRRRIRVSLPALYTWLRDEHGFEGSLRAVQRYYKQIFSAPAIRARRRVETVIGALKRLGGVLGDHGVEAVVRSESWRHTAALPKGAQVEMDGILVID